MEGPAGCPEPNGKCPSKKQKAQRAEETEVGVTMCETRDPRTASSPQRLRRHATDSPLVPSRNQPCPHLSRGLLASGTNQFVAMRYGHPRTAVHHVARVYLVDIPLGGQVTHLQNASWIQRNLCNGYVIEWIHNLCTGISPSPSPPTLKYDLKICGNERETVSQYSGQKADKNQFTGERTMSSSTKRF